MWEKAKPLVLVGWPRGVFGSPENLLLKSSPFNASLICSPTYYVVRDNQHILIKIRHQSYFDTKNSRAF